MRIFDEGESHNDEDDEEEDASMKAPGDVEERKSEGGRHGEVAEHTEEDTHCHYLEDVLVALSEKGCRR